MAERSRQDEDAVTDAVRRATTQALAGRSASAIVVLARWTLDLAVVARTVTELAGAAVVVGSSSQTVYARDDSLPSDVVITALGGQGLSARGMLSSHQDPTARGAEVAAAADGLSDAHRVVVLLPAGTTGDHQEVVRAAYEHLGPTVPLAGGGSTGDLVQRRSWQFLGREVVENGLVGLALGSDRPLGIGTAHGYHRTGQGMVVTESDGLLVRGLDGRGALDVYREHLVAAGVEVADGLDGDGWGRLASSHPLGLARRRRDEARTVIAVHPDQGALEFVSAVPQGSLVHLLSGTEDDMIAGARAACDEAVGALDLPAGGVILFSCLAREALLGGTGHLAEKAAARTASASQNVVLAYSAGEIARVRGSAGCHNQTVVALAL